MRILRPISDPDVTAEPTPSERLARRWFALVQQRAFDQLTELVHEEVHLVSKVRAGAVVDGRDNVAQFIEEAVAPSLFDAVTEVYTPLDDERIIVEGRLRWIDEARVIRDDPVVWAMEFRDELLLTFVPTRTTMEAEAILLRESS